MVYCTVHVIHEQTKRERAVLFSSSSNRHSIITSPSSMEAQNDTTNRSRFHPRVFVITLVLVFLLFLLSSSSSSPFVYLFFIAC